MQVAWRYGRAAAVMLACSAALYALHYAVFRDLRHIFLYLIGDIAFVPVQVLLVVLVIERRFPCGGRNGSSVPPSGLPTVCEIMCNWLESLLDVAPERHLATSYDRP